MVEIDSNAILIEPMKSCKDKEMIQAYNALLLRLKRTGIVPKKHVLDNEASEKHEESHMQHVQIQHGTSATRMSPTQCS